MYVLTSLQLLAQALVEIAVGGPFVAPKIALFTNDFYPSKNTTLADLVVTDFAGLTNKKAVVWGVPFVNDNGQAQVFGGLTNWLTVTLPDPAVIAYGYALLDTAGAVLLLAERFATPYSFNRVGQDFPLVPSLMWDS